MRLCGFAGLLLVLSGFCLAQDTNFSTGPQYLTNFGSPLFLHPIATPTLSLGEALPPVPNATELNPEQPISPSTPSDTFLGSVYWGEHASTEIVGRRLETPSMTPSETAWYMNAVASQNAPAPSTTSATAETPAGPSVIEITSAQLPANLPVSIVDVGVAGTASPQSLLIGGYGLPLGDVASYWKARKLRAPRVYTNADILRVHGS